MFVEWRWLSIADRHNLPKLIKFEAAVTDCHSMGMDWIFDALAGKFKAGHARKTFLRTGGGPNGTQGEGQDATHWWVK